MRNVLFLLLVVLLCADTLAGSVTIKKPGAALTRVGAGELETEDFDCSTYVDGLLVRPNYDIKYDFYLPNVVMTNLTVRVYGYVQFNLGFESPCNIRVGDIPKLLLEEEHENIFIIDLQAIKMDETDDGLCRKLVVEILPQNRTTYDLSYISVEYTVENVNSLWLASFQEALSGYHVLDNYKNDVIDSDLWDRKAAWDSLPFFFVDAYNETVSLGLDISSDVNPGLLTSLGNIYAFADYFFGFIKAVLWKMDQPIFWNKSRKPYGYQGPNLSSDRPSRINEAVESMEELTIQWYSTISDRKLSDKISTAINDSKTKLQSLRDQMKTAWTEMYRLYSYASEDKGYPENYAELMIYSLAPLLSVCDSETQELYTSLPANSYLDNLIQMISKQGTLVVTVKVSTYPSDANLRFEVDGIEYTQPVTLSWTPGSSHPLRAMSSQGEYLFSHWSDGGLPQHVVQPTTDKEYVAFYFHPEGESFEAVADATVWSKEPTNNFNLNWMWVQFNNDGRAISFFRFDLISIPKYAVVQSAELKLHCLNYYGDTNLLGLSRIVGGTWDENIIDYHHFPSPEDEPIAVNDLGNTTLYSWKSETYPKLKEVVQIWVKGPSVNWGFLLTGSGDGVWFYSSEESEQSRRPTLVVSYTAAPAGSLNVTIEPREICDQAKWRLTMGPDTNWQKSGATIPAVPVGSYMLEFSNVEGWTCPVARTIIIEEGANVEVGTYIRKITPPVVTTLTPTDVTLDSAELRGRLDDDGGMDCECGFMYGKASESYDTWTYVSCGAYATGARFYEFVDGLERGTEYGYYAVAENEAYITTGNTEIFTTTPNYVTYVCAAYGDWAGTESVPDGQAYVEGWVGDTGFQYSQVELDSDYGAYVIQSTIHLFGQDGEWDFPDHPQESCGQATGTVMGTFTPVRYTAGTQMHIEMSATVSGSPIGDIEDYYIKLYDSGVLIAKADSETPTASVVVWAGEELTFEIFALEDDLAPNAWEMSYDRKFVFTISEDEPVVDAPDLRGWVCNATDEDLRWGWNFPVQCQVNNQGTGSSGTFTQYFYLSGDHEWGDEDDYYLGSYTHSGLAGNTLGPEFTVELDLPEAPPHADYIGMNHYVGMMTDAESDVSESDETNNGPGDYTIKQDWDVISVVIPEEPVYFADENLKAAVEEKLGVTDPTPSDMLNLTSLRRGAFDLEINDLTGLEYATNLTDLYLNDNDNHISDISPLAGLTNLTHLELSECDISDISPLAGLTNLTHLGLNVCHISDISSLAGLTNLTDLGLVHNHISDISPLAGLVNLTGLSLYDNQISDISPLAELRNLTYLDLGNNPLNQDAYDIYIPQIYANNPGIVIDY